MSEPQVEVTNSGRKTRHENCECYQNHKSGELVVMNLQSAARERVYAAGRWSYARVLYEGDCVAVVQAHPAFQ